MSVSEGEGLCEHRLKNPHKIVFCSCYDEESEYDAYSEEEDPEEYVEDSEEEAEEHVEDSEK
jgi:hypothetical protein